MPEMPHVIGYTRRGVPIYSIAGGSPDAGDAGGTPEPGQGEPGNQPAAAAQGDQGGAAGDADLTDADRAALQGLIEKLRPYEKGQKLPAKIEKELNDLRAKVTEAEQAKLSDTERANLRIKELEAQVESATKQVQQSAVRVALHDAATAAKALYPSDVADLVSIDDVEFDSAGKVINAKALIEGVKKSRPKYFEDGAGPGTVNGGSRKPQGAEPDMNALIRAAARR